MHQQMSSMQWSKVKCSVKQEWIIMAVSVVAEDPKINNIKNAVMQQNQTVHCKLNKT